MAMQLFEDAVAVRAGTESQASEQGTKRTEREVSKEQWAEFRESAAPKYRQLFQKLAQRRVEETKG